MNSSFTITLFSFLNNINNPLLDGLICEYQKRKLQKVFVSKRYAFGEFL